jgi:hypothetical protein
MTIREAWKKRAEARQAVLDWMDAQAREGRLRKNSDAPGWPAYEAAERDLAEAVRIEGESDV